MLVGESGGGTSGGSGDVKCGHRDVVCMNEVFREKWYAGIRAVLVLYTGLITCWKINGASTLNV